MDLSSRFIAQYAEAVRLDPGFAEAGQNKLLILDPTQVQANWLGGMVHNDFVRKLKELGLTESLEVGYRLSPLGRAVVGVID